MTVSEHLSDSMIDGLAELTQDLEQSCLNCDMLLRTLGPPRRPLMDTDARCAAATLIRSDSSEVDAGRPSMPSFINGHRCSLG
jgi:hypothetical protein